MARIRTIKPDFFTSEDIIELSPLARLLYIAIWCEADREGRLNWKPKTFKIRYLPADACDIDALCVEIVGRGLVVQYGDGLAVIPSFHKHQHINPRESASILPEPPRVDDASGTRESRDSDVQVGKEGKEGIRASKTRTGEDEPHGFSECWNAYPKREGGNSRKEAEKAYRARLKAGVSPADLLAGVQRYAAYIRATGKDGSAYVKQTASFFGTGEHWREPWNLPATVQADHSCSQSTGNHFAGAV
jgi:hypothetical protein